METWGPECLRLSLGLRVICRERLRSGFAAARKFGVRDQTVKPFGSPGPVRGGQLERGADRRIAELKLEPNISGILRSLPHLRVAEQPLRREQHGRQGVAGCLRARFLLRRLELSHQPHFPKPAPDGRHRVRNMRWPR